MKGFPSLLKKNNLEERAIFTSHKTNFLHKKHLYDFSFHLFYISPLHDFKALCILKEYAILTQDEYNYTHY